MCEFSDYQHPETLASKLPAGTSPTDNWPQVEAASRAALTPEISDYVDACRHKPHPESHLISILHKVQGHFGYLANAQMDAVAQLLRVPAAKVTGVATFYHFFRLKPMGRFKVSVCLGTACYVKGAQAIADRLQAELGITYGETSADGMFTLEPARCLGTCGLAPVIMIDGNVHGPITADQVPAALEKYRLKAAAKATASA